MKVSQLISESSGNPVANQFIIETTEKYCVGGHEQDRRVTYFQSYDSLIVRKYAEKVHGGEVLITLDRDTWDYSTTTGRYRNQFLGETKKETEKKIKAGIYKLENLNGGN